MSNGRYTELSSMLSLETIKVGLPGETKEEVLDNLVDLLDGHPGVKDLDVVREAVFERESKMSTGVGKGVALPHAKTPAVRESMAGFAVTEHPIPFGAIDNEPVRLLFLLVGTEAAKSQHIKVLSRISRLLNRDQVRQRLLHAADAEEILRIFEAGEMELLEH